MSHLKEIIVDYYEDLISAIDLRSEKRLLRLNDEVKKAELNCVRETLIKKIQEIEQININNLKDDSEEPFQDKFCIFIPNKFKENYVSHSKMTLKFDNLIGKLVILNQSVDDEIIYEIIKRVNNEPSIETFLCADDITGLECYEDYIKFTVINGLINRKFAESPIIDLSVAENNALKIVELRDSSEFDETCFEFLPSILNVDSVEKLFIGHTQMAEIPSGVFKHFKNLNTLQLSFQRLEYIEKNAFSCFTNLEHLIIQKTDQLDIQPDAFNGLANLKELVLSHNNVDMFYSFMFNGLDNLEILDISHNSFDYLLTDTFAQLKKLKKLIIVKNPITKIEKAFNGLENLTTLELVSTKRVKLDTKAFDSLTNLEIVNFGNNNVKNFNPNAFRPMTNLKFLNLSRNYDSINTFEFLNSFSNLEFLDLTDLSIANPSAIMNYFDQLPIQNVKYFLFTNDKVPKFSPAFHNLKGLEIKKLDQFPEECFEHLSNLEYLKLDFDHDTFLPNLKHSHFHGLSNLKYLSIVIQEKISSSLENFQINKQLFLSLFDESSNDIKVKIDAIEYSEVCYVEICDCGSEKNYFKNVLNVSSELREFLLKSNYSEHFIDAVRSLNINRSGTEYLLNNFINGFFNFVNRPLEI